MKLTVFGSTGDVGQQIVAQALEQGHEVTAFTRSPEKIRQPHGNLKVVQGDVLDPAAVERAIQGQDAVLCALGMPLLNKENLRARGTKNIVRAMEKTGVKRFVCLSVFGAGDSYGFLPFHYKYFILPLLLRHVVADHGNQEIHIENSSLDWVAVRPGNFTKSPSTGSYRHDVVAPTTSITLKISRPDLAGFMLKQLAGDTYLHKAPWISY